MVASSFHCPLLNSNLFYIRLLVRVLKYYKHKKIYAEINIKYTQTRKAEFTINYKVINFETKGFPAAGFNSD